MNYKILKMSSGLYGVWLETIPMVNKCLAFDLPYRDAQKFVKQHKEAAECS